MTHSDQKMDRELRELGSVAPARSLWPEIEAQLARREKRRRRRVLVRLAAPAFAASVMLALSVVNTQELRIEEKIALQQTVDKAVRDARPQATFSGLSLVEGSSGLDALLISSRPRAVAINPPVNQPPPSRSGENRAKSMQLKEF